MINEIDNIYLHFPFYLHGILFICSKMYVTNWALMIEAYQAGLFNLSLKLLIRNRHYSDGRNNKLKLPKFEIEQTQKESKTTLERTPIFQSE